jgi:nucleosome binding factor SPN SPT16 subunit
MEMLCWLYENLSKESTKYIAEIVMEHEEQCRYLENRTHLYSATNLREKWAAFMEGLRKGAYKFYGEVRWQSIIKDASFLICPRLLSLFGEKEDEWGHVDIF